MPSQLLDRGLAALALLTFEARQSSDVGLPGHCRMLASLVSALDASHTALPSCDNQNVSRQVHMSPGDRITP